MTADPSIVACASCGKKNRVPAAAAGTPRCGSCHAALPWIVDAGDDTYDEIVDQSRLPVLVDLWAQWCAPCRMVSPALERLAGEYAGRMKLVKVNVDGSPRISERFEARSIPTLLVVSGGEVVARQTGAAPEAALRTWLDAALAKL